jgi:hypothetical protein
VSTPLHYFKARNIIMGKNFTAVFAVCLAISSLPLACGDDEDDGGSGGKGGTSGSAGKGGKGGTSGSSGSAGKGGTSGTAGTSTGGRAGTSGTSGTSGTAGTDGGAGAGGAPGGEGGVGGEGGSDTPPMTQCERICAKAAAANCDDHTTCEADVCQSLLPGNDCDDEGQEALDCMDAGPASNFTCFKGKTAYNFGMGSCDVEFYAALTCT